MESTQAIQDVKEITFPATVVSIINRYKLAINRGTIHGLKEGQRVLVYRMSEEELRDPNSGESLGYLEIVKGKGRIIHVQEKSLLLNPIKSSFGGWLLNEQVYTVLVKRLWKP